jgi:hypothetical protein
MKPPADVVRELREWVFNCVLLIAALIIFYDGTRNLGVWRE